MDVDEQDAWRVQPRAAATAAVRANPTQQTPLEFVRFFKPDGFPIHVGQQMDVFIEARAKSAFTANKSDAHVLKTLARSSYK